MVNLPSITFIESVRYPLDILKQLHVEYSVIQ